MTAEAYRSVTHREPWIPMLATPVLGLFHNAPEILRGHGARGQELAAGFSPPTP